MNFKENCQPLYNIDKYEGEFKGDESQGQVTYTDVAGTRNKENLKEGKSAQSILEG
jgi:hypothetical protein